MGNRDGCLLDICNMAAAVLCRRSGRIGALRGSGLTLARVGDGKSGISSSSSEYTRVSHLNLCWVPGAKIFLAEGAGSTGRRGERAREAIAIGEGSPICISIGESIVVLERLSGVRVSLLSGLSLGGGESSESSLRSVIDGKSVSSLPLTEDADVL